MSPEEPAGHDPHVAVTDPARRTPLHYAALDGDEVAARALLDAGDEPDPRDESGFTPLHFAAQESSVGVARLLLYRGADVDATNVHGNTPLFVAVFNSKGRGEMIELLRSRGADPHHANKVGQTPVGLARSIDNFDVASYFADIPGT